MIYRPNLEITTEGMRMRLIDLSDANFIVQLRTNKSLNRFISYTSPSIESQENWLRGYKIREKQHKEFYFIFEDAKGIPWGTIRIYNLNETNFTLGSWLCLPGKTNKIALKAHIKCLEFGFSLPKLQTCLIDTRKQNTNVVRYLNLFEPTLIDEDELNYHFALSKNVFYRKRNKVVKIFALKI